MKIGIIVYSRTGNTQSVAEKLKEKLAAGGHSVEIARVVPEDGVQPVQRNPALKTRPAVDAYEALVFGSPVQAFSLAQVTDSYLSQLDSLAGKKVALLVTEALPYPWMGGNRAVSRMKKLAASKGAEVLGFGIVNWSRRDREQRISRVVDDLAGLF
jgi:flavodoxin